VSFDVKESLGNLERAHQYLNVCVCGVPILRFELTHRLCFRAALHEEFGKKLLKHSKMAIGKDETG
jgi:hypothetical protein